MSDDWTQQGLASKPWFKPAVGLWFALLIGGGLYLMPASVHASIAQATGIGGRLLISAIAGIFGFFLGFAIAARIALAATPRAIAPGLEVHEDDGWGHDEEEEPRRRRVFSAREDIGEEGIGIADPETGDDEEPAREFEDIMAGIPDAVAEDDWDADETVIEMDDRSEDTTPDEVIDEPVIEEAEFETIEDEAEPATEPAPETPRVPEALGDMSLQQLEDRLAAALENRKQAVTADLPRDTDDQDAIESQLGEPDDDDPVIAFLRREASRQMPERNPEPPKPDYDAQAALREALDKLGKVGKPVD